MGIGNAVSEECILSQLPFWATEREFFWANFKKASLRIVYPRNKGASWVLYLRTSYSLVEGYLQPALEVQKKPSGDKIQVLAVESLWAYI